MMSTKKVAAGVLALTVGGAVAMLSQAALASDHAEAPGASALPVADIGDYWAWHEGDVLNMVLTYSTSAAPGASATFSDQILYTLHFDTTGDNLADVEVYTRFAQDPAGNFGFQITGIGDTTIVGPVEQTVTAGDVSVFAGSFEDPFFFDEEGFDETVATGILSFDPTRDQFAGLNVTSIVLQAPLSSIVGDVTVFDTWATSGTL